MTLRCVLAATCGAFILTFLPYIASAETISAGFPPHSLWLSKMNASAGENIHIYTVVFDSGTSSVTGQIDFFVDDASIATRDFKLAAGESSIISTDWTAQVGTHSFTARIDELKDSETGQPISISNASAGSISLAVSPPLPPSPVAAAVSSAQATFASTSPVVIQTASNIVQRAESVRKSAVSALQGALQKASKSGTNAPQGFVLGTSTKATQTASPGSLFPNIWQAILQGLLFVCQIQWLFYVALLAIIYILYKLMRTYFRERRHPSF